MPNHMPGAARFIQSRMSTPTETYNAASWLGNSMQQHAVTSLLPFASFTTRGKGTQSLTRTVPPGDARFVRGPRISGRQGTVDLFIKGGATDTLTILDLHDEVTDTTVLEVAIDSNVFQVTMVDNLGNTVGLADCASVANMVDGRTSHIQVAWSSVEPIEGARHMKVLVNGVLVPAGDYSTEPTSPWVYLQPTQCILDTTFDGEVLGMQGSTQVVI